MTFGGVIHYSTVIIEFITMRPNTVHMWARVLFNDHLRGNTLVMITSSFTELDTSRW